MLFGDRELAERIERNEAEGTAGYVGTLGALAPDLPVAVEAVGRGYVVRTGAQYPINRAYAISLDAGLAASDLERIEQIYDECGLPAEIELCPFADQRVIDLLAERGYAANRFMNVLARPLTEQDAQPGEQPVAIRELPGTDRELWVTTVARGFGGGQEPNSPSIMLPRTAAGQPGVRCFVAEIDGEAVGAGALRMRGEFATLFSTSTRAEFRGRGAQTALILARLAAAQEAGCSMALVQTTPGTASQRNLQRLGFALLYTKAILQQRRR